MAHDFRGPYTYEDAMATTEFENPKLELQHFEAPKTLNELRDLQHRITELLRAHETKWAQRKLCSPKATPAQRAAILGQFDTHEALLAAAGTATNVTSNKYLGQGRQSFKKACDERVSVWELGIQRSSTTGSWYTFRAAMQFYLVDEMVKMKATVDDFIVAIDNRGQAVPPELGKKSKYAIANLPKLAEQLAALPAGLPLAFAAKALRSSTPPASSTVEGVSAPPKRRRRSKAASLKGLPADWREQMAATMKPNLRRRWLMQCVTGCRSEELKNGVTVMLRSDGYIETRVVGAKIGKQAGQPIRKMTVPAQAGVALALANLLKPEKPFTCEFRSADVDAHRKAVTRVGQRVFPERKSVEQITPYSARNQFKADIAQSKLSREKIAKAMGHSTTRSAAYYGRGVKSGGSGCVTPIKVDASRSVKTQKSVPLQVMSRKQNRQVPQKASGARPSAKPMP